MANAKREKEMLKQPINFKTSGVVPLACNLGRWKQEGQELEDLWLV